MSYLNRNVWIIVDFFIYFCTQITKAIKMNRLLTTLAVLMMALSASAQALKAGRDLPAVPVIPEVDSPKPNGSIEPACETMLEEVGRWIDVRPRL